MEKKQFIDIRKYFADRENREKPYPCWVSEESLFNISHVELNRNDRGRLMMVSEDGSHYELLDNAATWEFLNRYCIFGLAPVAT